jgi:hypothetical protein
VGRQPARRSAALEKAGAPSKLITLTALAVLRRIEGAA